MSDAFLIEITRLLVEFQRNSMISDFLNSTVWLDIEEWTISWTIGGTNWFPLLESILCNRRGYGCRHDTLG